MAADEAIQITDELVTGKLFRIHTRMAPRRYLEPAGVTEHFGGGWTCRDTDRVAGECLFARRELGEPGRDAQLFHLFRMGEYSVCIAPVNTAAVVDYAYGAVEWAKRVVTWKPHGRDNQIFSLIRPAGADGGVLLQSRHGNVVLDVYQGSDRPDNWIVGWDREHPPHRRQLFELEEAGRLPLRPLRPRTGDVLSLGTDAVPLIRQLGQELPKLAPASGPVVIGESYLPFIVVNDPGLSPADQATKSPYYILRREQLWRPVYDTRLGPGQSYEHIEEVGITRELETSMDGTLGISLEPSLGFTYKAITAAIGGKLSGELRISEKNRKVFTSSSKVTFSITPSDKTRRAVWWRLIDRYVLERMDGSQAASWELLLPSAEVRDTYVAP